MKVIIAGWFSLLDSGKIRLKRYKGSFKLTAKQSKSEGAREDMTTEKTGNMESLLPEITLACVPLPVPSIILIDFQNDHQSYMHPEK